MNYSSLQQREIFHFLFLEQLFRCSDPRLYVVKGGVNLRFFFHSPRYSEDIDIDVLGGSVETLRKTGYKILAEPAFARTLRTYGIEELVPNDPLKAKHTETTQRFRLRLVTTAGEQLPTKIEFSRRRSALTDPYQTDLIDPEIARRYQRVSIRAQHYGGVSAVIQKVRALADRSETQARDAFDLYLLYAAGHATKELVSAQCDEALRDRARQRMAALTFEHLRGQVLEFLEGPARAEYDSSSMWTEIVRCVDGGVLCHE